ncbi:FecR family protein [Parasphingorhabdus sp.]|uniref:FecR family protein n=1 Tax=Parasphingorhabdus sp. TaxID=2709688 RepID=UPI003C735B9E
MNENNAFPDNIYAEAVRWLLRQRDADMPDHEWADFAQWLETTPGHLAAYNAAVEADEDLGAIGSELAEIHADDGIADNDNKPIGLFSRWPAFGAVAAMLLAAIIFWPGSQSPQYATLQTEYGEIREVAINSSVSMVLNGNTELALDKDAATVRMLRGEATYSVESPRPGALRVEVDGLTIVDYGTVFNVIRDNSMLRVAVTEGAVMIGPEREKILVSAGEQIEMQLNNRSLTRSKISQDAVLAWQDQQLVFENRTVKSVIGDVERNFGTNISVASRLSDRKITGVISLASDEAAVISDVAAVLGETAQKTESGWRIGD